MRNKKRKLKLGAVLLCIVMGGCSFGESGSKDGGNKEAGKVCTQDVFAMDTYMGVTAYGSNGEKAVNAAVKEIKRLDSLWSVSSEQGEIYKVNQEGEGNLSEDTYDLVCEAKSIYQMTDGAFDMTVYPLMELWGFTSGNYKVPLENEIQTTLKKVDQSRVKLTKDRRIILEQGQQMDLGAIAKGFTSSRIMEIYKENGVTSGRVSLGGNVQVLGTKPDGTKWKIGIQDPESAEGDIIGVVSLADQAVITSGGYERYFEEDGKRYHHILDTTNGYPADSGLSSVSIISADGTLADGLSTALFVMGKEKAIEFWREHPDAFDTVLVETDGSIYVTEGLEDCFSSERAFEIVRSEE